MPESQVQLQVFVVEHMMIVVAFFVYAPRAVDGLCSGCAYCSVGIKHKAFSNILTGFVVSVVYEVGNFSCTVRHGIFHFVDLLFFAGCGS